MFRRVERAFAVVAVLVLLVISPDTGRAQLPHLLPPGSNWLDVNYPKLFWTPREGATIGAYLGFIRALNFENADSPAPYAAAVTIDGQLSTSGSRQLILESRLPAFVKGWRFATTLQATRKARDNYYGLGNGTTYNEDLSNDFQPYYYQARVTRTFWRAEVQRIITGGLRALGGFDAGRWEIAPPSGPSLLASDSARGIDPTIGVPTNDVAFRLGLVYDTRDDEVAPNKGLLIYVVHGISSKNFLSDLSYTRTTASAAGYHQLTENLGVAGRITAQDMGGTPYLGAYYIVEAPDRQYSGVGGALSQRALPDNRLLGTGKLQYNLDVRYHVLNLPRTARVTLVGFLDAGRVFQDESFKFTFKGLSTGGGLGLFLQLARAGIGGVTAGYGPNGATLDFATRWTY